MKKPRKRFLKFLTSSLENRLTMSETQIKLLEPEITEGEILDRIQAAEWSILEQRVENDVAVYSLIDSAFVCTCGNDPVHWHNGKMACCGGSDCCPEAEPPDYELQIAWKLACIRNMLEERRNMSPPPVLT